jgi:molybdenum cofactor synthesis domain-containing protein
MTYHYFEIISIGNELLIGKTINTNGYWLSKRITNLGGFVKRSSEIRDDVDEISAAINESLGRGVNWIITSGGLGPTYDDKTLTGVAKSFNLKLKLDEKSLKMITEKYMTMARMGVIDKMELTPSRKKMATLPVGSSPLANPVGTAPGVFFEKKGVRVFCLPGVPSELKAIFKRSVAPVIKENLRSFYYDKTVLISNIVESKLAPFVEVVARNNPHVYVKSHPKGREDGITKIELQITAFAENQMKSKQSVDDAMKQLILMIKNHNGIVDNNDENS